MEQVKNMQGPLLLDTKSLKPFNSTEEYILAMREDLAEWLQSLYPHLTICTENFLDKLETGVTLCEHANAVKVHAVEYLQRKQARKLMTKPVTGSLAQAQALIEISEVKYFATAKAGTFFARDNVCNFIKWCRQSLQIIECLLFETDDLILRKNEKHVILCLLEVARRGAKFGMLAPIMVQMERQIDREIAADQRKLEMEQQGYQNQPNQGQNGLHDDDDDETDSEMEDEKPILCYGPLPQIITNDLKSLDEMVRDLVEKCTCPTQFPMIRVSEGKYRIGDTKVLIFVRILRNHVMVRVGGGWDTLSHYLDKHDPCRCRSQHRSTQSARLDRTRTGTMDLQGAQVYYDRSSTSQNYSSNATPNGSSGKAVHLGPPMNAANRSRSRSPSSLYDNRRSVSPFGQRKSSMLLPPSSNRSRSPTPCFTSTHTARLAKPTTGSLQAQAPQSLPFIPSGPAKKSVHPSNHVAHLQIPVETKSLVKTEAVLQVSGDSSTDQSDNASEVSDEGYRSLGILPDKNKHLSTSSHNSEDAEETEHRQTVDLDIDTNDCGLRKTRYSTILTDAPQIPKLSTTSSRQPSAEPEKPPSRRNSLTQNTRHYSMERTSSNLEKRSPSSRRNSTERDSPRLPASPKKTQNRSINNTWNGRGKSSRAFIMPDTFNDHFSRNSPTRRSNYDHNGRRVSISAATSPTKTSSFRDEIQNALYKESNEESLKDIIAEILKINKPFDSPTSTLSKRKDSKPENLATRIPAPVSN